MTLRLMWLLLAVYLSELYGHRVRRIRDGTVDTLARTGEAGANDGPAATATFSAPRGLFWAPSGGLLVADSGSHRLRLITPLIAP